MRDDNQPITLQDAADRLGVHYMTAYRYVRTGRLAAAREHGQWMVDPAAVRALKRGPSERSRPAPPVRGPGRAVAPLARSLAQGDEAAAWQQAQDQLAYGVEPEELYLDVLRPAMVRIGDDWERGAITVGQEHQAAAVMQRIIGRLGPLFATRGRKRGVIVLGTPARERHSLPVSLLADPLRGRRFEVVDLGADVPPESFAAAAIAADRLVAAGLCATTASERSIRETVRALHDAGVGPVVLGGAAVADERAATRLGADLHTADAAGALALFESLAPGRR